MLRFLITFIGIAFLCDSAASKTARNSVERYAFVKGNPCPATERRRLPCPGYHIDHIEPLCAGGPDHRSNMQWITIEDHKVKTRGDVRACRAYRQ